MGDVLWQLGGDDAGFDRGDPYVGKQLLAQGLGPAVEAPLGRCVDPVAGASGPSGDGGDVDDVDAALRSVGSGCCGGWSGFRDGAAEGLQGDGLRLGAAALAGVEAVDGGELVGGEVEVEDVEVLGDAVRLGRLRDDRAALLQVPAQHHLGRGLVVRLGDLADDRVLQGAAVAAVAVEGDAADR